MNNPWTTILATACLAFGGVASSSQAQQGTPAADTPPSEKAPLAEAPAYRLSTMTGEIVDSTQRGGRAVILIYALPRQRGSERAILDASQIVKDLGDKPIDLLIVTAKEDQRPYFEQFWSDESVEGTLAFDPDRKLYAELKLIAFPATFVIDPEGRIAHRIPTHSSHYRNDLDGYARSAMGLLNESGLAERLEARNTPLDSSKSLASRHRSAARLMREKGYLDAAEKELLVALEIDPDSVDARLDLADLYIYLKRLDEAGQIIDEVLEIDTQHRRVLLLRGILMFRQNKLDEAQAVLTKVLVLNPDPARTHYYLGRIYEAKGISDQALVHYRQALGKLLDEPTD